MDWPEVTSPISSTDEISALGLLSELEAEERLVELPATPTMDQSPDERLQEQGNPFSAVVQALDQATINPTIDINDFLSEYGCFANRIFDEVYGNVIHVIVELIKHRAHLVNKIRPALQQIVTDYPILLVEQNTDGYNPLHLAIKFSSYKLFGLFVSICTEGGSDQTAGIKPYFDKALLQTSSAADRTVLHTFFKNASGQILEFGTAEILIKHATDEQLAAQDAYGNTPMHYATSLQHCTIEGLKVVKMLIDRDQNVLDKGQGLEQARFLEIRNAKGHSIYQSLVQSMEDERRRREVEMQNEYPLQETAFRDISLLLKKHYLRTRGHREATSFLYGENMDDIQISFHYNGLPTNINWQDFTDRFGQDSTSGIKLDSVLQSVSFPRINVNQYGENIGELFPRDDMTHVFRWLHAKGVRHVISLSVDDCGGPKDRVHTSEALQKCLSHFTIERLDWQRIDVALEDIYEAISQWPGRNPHTKEYALKELWLRWSGNSVALHSWSRKKGLPKFLGLERICLFKPERHKMRGNEEHIERAIIQFRQELAENSPGIEVVVKETVAKPDDMRGSPITPIRTRVDVDPDCGSRLRQHLESASRFSDQLNYDWRCLSKQFREKSASTAGDDVVVAVIGDGVDIMDKALHNRCLIGKSFDYQEGVEDGETREVFLPPFVSGVDGTVIANIILRVCPMAKIYPIRLPTGGLSLEADSLAKAVEAALAKKATIISLPRLMMPELTRVIPQNERLIRALKRVEQEKVLMFCSSTSIGLFDAYPKGIFFIDDTCNVSDERLRDSDQYFVFPGLDPLLDAARSSMSATSLVAGFTQRFADFECASYKSVSTALATGLAAVIIYLVKLGVMMSGLRQDNADMMASVVFKENAAETITQPEVMARVFRGLCPSFGTPDLVDVWDSLDRLKSELSLGGLRSRQRVLLGITYMLLLNCR
ncbi:hypothetical protein J3F83DRAFT_772331 [Trichoderma novae-zelandiae]